jgi:hypothetical protein
MAVAPDHRDAGLMAVYYGRQSIGVANSIEARNVDVVLDWPAGRVRDGMANAVGGLTRTFGPRRWVEMSVWSREAYCLQAKMGVFLLSKFPRKPAA